MANIFKMYHQAMTKTKRLMMNTPSRLGGMAQALVGIKTGEELGPLQESLAEKNGLVRGGKVHYRSGMKENMVQLQQSERLKS